MGSPATMIQRLPLVYQLVNLVQRIAILRLSLGDPAIMLAYIPVLFSVVKVKNVLGLLQVPLRLYVVRLLPCRVHVTIPVNQPRTGVKKEKFVQSNRVQLFLLAQSLDTMEIPVTHIFL